MAIEVFSIDDDYVIDSKFISGKTDYRFAIQRLYPLIDKLDLQRKLQNPSFYKRLRQDILKGCIMPPLTLAFVIDKAVLPVELLDASNYINDNINKAFILDGIQRINALHQTYVNPEINADFPEEHPLFVNVIICKSMDNLLYRMITLNNGQRPMTANHQIEILLGNVFEFKNLDIIIQTEKEKGKKGKYRRAFEKSTIIKAYMAFISNSTAIDNKKIIESKLDELIAKKIIDSNITEDELEFGEVISLINRLSEDPYFKKWFDNVNTIIGFSVGIKESFEVLRSIEIKEFKNAIIQFEIAFNSMNLSTIKLSRERRKLVKYFISNYDKIGGKDSLDLLDVFNEEDV